ncbi:MAG: NUDIX domain-containing protein [Treponema sp.]|nr:NUDIX domain-containing protein [Treponema sp.]
MNEYKNINDVDWKNWIPDEKGVIVYMIDRAANRVLLIDKKTGMGKGKVNAPGGRVEKGETAAAAAVRECQEEVSMTPFKPEKRAELFFHFTSGYKLYGEAFFSYSWEGVPTESIEAGPFWCDLDKVPWEKMWEDDRQWLPATLEGKKMRGYYIFDEDDMLYEKLEEVKNFED